MTLLLELAYYVLYDGACPVASTCTIFYVMYELVLTVNCLCYVMNEMLVLYAMNMLIDAIDTRRYQVMS